jgi:2-haloalkanoic acid dehalogenase type II
VDLDRRRSAKRPRKSAANIEAVAFDGYGTIFDFTEPDFIVTMAEICDQQGLDADAADLWRRFLRAAYLMRSEHHHDPVYKRYDQAWLISSIHLKRLRLGDPWAAANHLKAPASAPLFDDAHPVIDAVRPHYRLALLSNADDDFLTECLARNGLTFETVVTSEQAGAIKPNPAIFNYLTTELAVPPEESVMSATIDTGYPGPAPRGMLTAWLNPERSAKARNVPHPHFRLRSLGPHPLLGRRHD